MDNSLTISGLTFNLGTPDKGMSIRREVSRGPNLPCVLSIGHKPYVDSRTKIPGVSTVLRLDRYVAGTSQILAGSCYMVTQTPSDALIVTADVLASIDLLLAVVNSGEGNLGLAEEIFVERQQ